MARAAREVLEDVELPKSNKDARAAGVSRYFTGLPCKRGHIALRAVGGACVECKAEDGRGEQNRAACRDRYNANKRAYIDRAKAWVDGNREKAYAAAKKWGDANPVKKRAYCLSRRGRVANGGGKISAEEILKVIKRQKGNCAACGLPAKLQMDHILPLALGGDSLPRNIQGLCQPCNGRKHAKHPIDFNRSRGLLL